MVCFSVASVLREVLGDRCDPQSRKSHALDVVQLGCQNGPGEGIWSYLIDDSLPGATAVDLRQSDRNASP